ncbi:MAG: response regulator [Myxococcales bacterium]|nr:response regulator [Myxococcales bacterium]MCB9627725.1 response regulator [Sandaracinaceae bacterium]
MADATLREHAVRDTGPAGACLIDLAGRVAFVDAAAARLTTGTLNVGDRLSERIPWAPASFDVEGSVVGQLGSRRVQLTWTPVVAPDSAPGVLALVVFEDHDALRELEDGLRVASETLRSLVAACPVGIVTLDVDMLVTRWNPAAEALFGWSSEEVLGRPYPLVPRSEWPSFVQLFQRVMDGQGFTGVEARRTRKDGAPVELSVHTAPMRDPTGTVVGALALLEDLSERRKLEERVRHAQTMEAVGRLAGGIAHDFNNMLAVILGLSEVLLLRPDTAPDSRQHALREIVACAERARKLTAQLLTFSRRQVLRPEVRSLSALVNNATTLLRSVLGEEVTLQHVPPSASLADVCVRVDANQFDQLLVNLAVNARDAMSAGGVFTLRIEDPVAGRATDGRAVDAAGGGLFAVLAVEDTGAGIPADALPLIFDPFFTTKPDGTGLGLASVYGIVQQSGGFIEVASEPGRGTRFRVHLPLVAQEGPGQAHVSAVPHAEERLRGGEHVLVVEDEATVRMVTAHMLETLGYRVTTATDGVDAQAVLAAHPDVAVVITDLSMPRMNGRALALALEHSHPNLPVVFMSAHLDVPDLRSRVEQGRVAFIQKPATREQLGTQVRATLRKAGRDTVATGQEQSRQ